MAASPPKRRYRSMPELRILRLIARQLPRIGLAALISAGAELAGIALIATAAWLLATASQQPPLTALTVAIVAVRAFALSRGLLRYLDRLVGHDAVLRALAVLRGRVFQALTPLSPSGDRSFRGGDLLTRLVSDVDAVQDLVLRVVTPISTALIVCSAAVGFTAIFSPTAAVLLAVGLLGTGLMLPLLTARLAAAAARRTATQRGTLAASTVDLVDGAADLAAYGATAEAIARARRQAEALATAEQRGGTVTSALSGLATLLTGLTTIGVLWAAADLGVLAAVLALTALVTFETTAALPDAARRLVEVRSAARRLGDLLDATAIVPDPAVPQPLPRHDYRLTLRGLRPGIPGGVCGGPGVDLDLTPGKRVAIVGASGAGKTMLLHALVRFTGIAEGRAELGGVDVTRLRGEDVRTVIGGMLSESYLFNASVRDNLLIGDPDATDARLCDSLRRAGLGDLDLSTSVGRDGGAISGGQRQRLLLARALLAGHRILLLDEPTEHLDPETADAILADVLAQTGDRSLLLVTHRLTGLEHFDEIVVLDEHTVAERGSHTELLAADGPYRQLWGTFRPLKATISP
jgi:ATP-binding cassette subfamily C protein CydC